MKHIYLFTACFLLISPFAEGQTGTFDKNADIRLYFRFEKYEEALSLINSSRRYAQDTENMLLAAIAYYHLNELDKSEVLLKELLEKQKNPFPEAWLFLGKIYHHKHQFTEASEFYRQYLRNIGNNLFERSYTWNLIRSCANGLQLQYREADAFVENLGSEVNTKSDEFCPRPSPNFGPRLYFSSVRPGNMGGAKNQYGISDPTLGFYKSDMFSAINKNGVWTEVTPMHYLLNSPNHDILLGFDKNGQKMYYFQGNSMAEGNFMEDIFRRDENRSYNSFPISIPLSINNGDDTPQFVSDNLVLFASNRDGGFGGYDLYKMEKKEGKWQEAVNLGPNINSPADERSPFLCRDGITLYFSSNDSEKSIGGLDIFKSTYIESIDNWTPPQNLGMPINSAGDEEHYYINDDGFSAFFSSSRKDGFGQRDIYIAFFSNFLPEMEYPDPVANTLTPSKPLEDTQNQIITDKPIQQKPNPLPPAPSQQTVTTPQSNPFSWHLADRFLLPEKDLAFWQVKMIAYPEINLLLSLEYDHPNPANDLSDFVAMAEEIQRSFVAAGIGAERLSYRIIPNTSQGGNAAKGLAHLQCSFFPKNPGKTVPEAFVNPEESAPYASLKLPFMYKVQIASSKSAGILQIMEKYLDKHTTIEKNKTGFLRLTIGAFDNYSDAQRYKQEMVDKGIRDAYIVPFIFGVRAEKQRVELFSQQFPDFLHYLNAF